MPEMTDPIDAPNGIIEDEDAEIVKRCQMGHAEAFSELVRRHQKKMINIAYRMIGDYDAACDVVQEAFLSAYRAIGRFRGTARFSTWLCGIVLNQARTHMKQKSIQNGREIRSHDGNIHWIDNHMSYDAPSGDVTAVERIERQKIQTKVQECITKLEGDQREVLVLRDIQEYSYEEIGAILKLPQGTVRSRLFRARNDLKRRLLKVSGDAL